MAIGLIKDCIKEKTEILASQGAINHTFPRLHDSYSSDPAIYLNECVFSWQNLLVEPLNRFEPKHMVRDTNFVLFEKRNLVKITLVKITL